MMKGELNRRPILQATAAVLLVSCIRDDPAGPPSLNPGSVSYSTISDGTTIPTFGGCCGGAYGVNDNGVIVGISQTLGSVRAFKFVNQEPQNFTDGDGIASSASVVSIRGVIVGSISLSSSASTAFRYGHLNSNTLEFLPKPPLSSAAANAVNDIGVVVGWYVPNNGFFRIAALWDANSDANFTSLGMLGGATSEALDINQLGTVVGYTNTAIPGQFIGFKWTAATGMQPLPLLPNATSSRAFAINEAGQIVGRMNIGGAGGHVVIWELDGTVRDIGVFPGSSSTEPYDINDSEQIVGWDISTNQGFVWDSIEGWRGLGAPSKAHAINNKGLIVGEREQLNVPAYWQLTPESARVVIELAPGDSLQVRPSEMGGDTTVVYRVSVVNSAGQRLSNKMISLTLAAIPLSGGHNHTHAGRPAGSLNDSTIVSDNRVQNREVYSADPRRQDLVEGNRGWSN